MDPFEQQRETARRQEAERQRVWAQQNLERQQKQLQDMGDRQRKQRRDSAVEAEQARLARGREAYYQQHPEEVAQGGAPAGVAQPQSGARGGYVRGTAWSDPTADSRAPSARESRLAGPKARWRASEIGQARDVSVQSPRSGIDMLVGFRLERYDARSGRLGPVAVRLAGDGALGFVSEGDWVEVAGKAKRGVIDGSRAYNHTTRTDFKRSRYRRFLVPLMVVFLLGWFAFLGYWALGGSNIKLPDFNGLIPQGQQQEQQQPTKKPARTPRTPPQPTVVPPQMPTEEAPQATWDQVGWEACIKDGIFKPEECDIRFPK